MDKLIVKFPRSLGDVLVRMKAEYEDLGVSDQSFITILAPRVTTELLKRYGAPYSVKEDSAVADVLKALELSVVAANKIPADFPLHDELVVNQANATIEKVDNQHYTVSADFSKLSKGTDGSYRLILGVATGESTVVGLSVGGKELDDAAVSVATSLGLAAGSFAYGLSLNKEITKVLIENDGKATIVEIAVVNTEA